MPDDPNLQNQPAPDPVLVKRLDELTAQVAKSADPAFKEFLAVIAEGSKKTLEEMAGLRTRLDAAETATQAAKAAELADKQKAAEAATRGKIAEVAKAAGAVDADAVVALLKLSDVTTNDAGETNVADLVEKMKVAKPGLFAKQSTSAAANPPPPGDPAQKRARDMTPEENDAALRKLGVDPSRIRRR